MGQERVAVVVGVGPGLGGAVCRRLAAAGYAVAGLARSKGFGADLADEIRQTGQRMSFYPCDVTDAHAVPETFARITAELGAPDVLVYTAGAFLHRDLCATEPEEFRDLWALNCQGAFLCARSVVPGMLETGRGTIIFTGATASVKAGAEFSAFAAAKFALRGLAQSLARELGPRGIHVVHVVIDGIIWTPRTRDAFGAVEERCLRPQAIAETYWHLVEQDRSAWTHELDIRPDVESF